MNFQSVSFEITNTSVAEYNAGTEPTNAPDPRSQGWTNTPSVLSGTSTNAISPDRGPGVVTTLADGGYGSLREAIGSVRAGDIITFATNGTILLTSGQFDVSNSIAILGPGPANLRIDAGGDSRVFRIVSGITTLFAGITITNGRPPT